MNKKLRLLVTSQCHRNCALCCNKSFDLNKLPVVEHFDYEEIMITGGEPALVCKQVQELEISIKTLAFAKGVKPPKIYVYTAMPDRNMFIQMLSHSDGIVLTLHDEHSLPAFIELNDWLIEHAYRIVRYSLRLKIFDKSILPKDVDLSLWHKEETKWIENCPLPEGEDFRRIKSLWYH